MMTLHIARFSGTLATAILLAGCGFFDSHDSEENLAPGAMRVISVTPLDNDFGSRENLFPAGEFRNWWTGAPVPEGFHLKTNAPAALNRLSRSDGDGFRAKQTWKGNDDPQTLSNLLHTMQFNARANEPFEIEILATVLGGQFAHVGLWMTDNDGNEILLDPYFISLYPGNGVLKKYVRTFSLPNDGQFRFAVHGRSSEREDGVEAAVLWYAWFLRSAGTSQ